MANRFGSWSRTRWVAVGATVAVLPGARGVVTTLAASSDSGSVLVTKADTADLNSVLLTRTTWPANVDRTGDKKGTGNFTSARTAVWVYDVIWDLTSLVLAEQFFNATAKTMTLGCNAAITNRSITSVDGDLTFSKLIVRTTNNVESAAGCTIFVMAMLQGPNVVTPPLSLSQAASLETADPTATATCSTDGDITTCVD
jgi:hypothetical protein